MYPVHDLSTTIGLGWILNYFYQHRARMEAMSMRLGRATAERVQIAFVMHPTDHTHLERAEWERLSPAHSSLQMAAEEHCCELCDITTRASTSPPCRQGQWSISFYAEEFKTLAYVQEWPAASLKDVFLQADDNKDLMAAYEQPTSLEGAIKLAI